jgi:hypothetical protein
MTTLTYARACVHLHDLITERHGAHADVLDGLHIRSVPCPHYGSGRKGAGLIAWPKGESVTAANMLLSYYGDDLTGGRV